jgi:hypothetical protein
MLFWPSIAIALAVNERLVEREWMLLTLSAAARN